MNKWYTKAKYRQKTPLLGKSTGTILYDFITTETPLGQVFGRN